MNALTRNFLISKFREYYIESSLDLPPNFESREWGFLFFDESGMRRHKSYLSRGELADYVRSMVPRHIYHSAAYYQRPGAPTMKEKLWQGADLIFDLDADHLRKAPSSYGEMLARVKKETQKLLAFLLSDFGFSESKITVVFSGGRGYHIHVRDPRIFALGSDERREVVDYLTGRGLDIDRFIYEVRVGGDYGVKSATKMTFPKEGSPGWGDRINRSVSSFVTKIRGLDKEEALEFLSQTKGLGPKKASDFYQSLLDDRVIEEIQKGNLDFLKYSSAVWGSLLGEYLEREKVNAVISIEEERGETDEPVTADVRRLIRCPGSLHGGTGFRVTPLTLSDLEDFDPLEDAVVFGDDPVPLEMLKPFSTQMRGESFRLVDGPAEVPMHAAVFLMARGVAEARAKFLSSDKSI